MSSSSPTRRWPGCSRRRGGRAEKILRSFACPAAGRPSRLAAHGAAGPTTVSTGYLPGLGAALQHGPWIAGLCAFAVTPGALVVIARVLERRWLVPREQFA